MTEANETHNLDGRPLLRLAALGLGGLEVILFTLGAQLLLLSSNTGGEAHEFEAGPALAVLLPLMGLTLPGLALAWLDRAHITALALVIAAVPTFAAAWIAWA